MKYFKLVIISCLILLLLSSCTTVPKIQRNTAWTRYQDDNKTIKHSTSLKLVVHGVNEELISKGIFLDNKIKDQMQRQLIHRGFTVQDSNYQYTLNLHYKTRRIDKLQFVSEVQFTSYSHNEKLYQTIFDILNDSDINYQLKSKNVAESKINYAHIINLEIYNLDNELIWQAESTWDSANLDIQYDLNTYLIDTISKLPYNQDFIPCLDFISDKEAVKLFDETCRHRYFVCSGLAFYTKFISNPQHKLPISVQDNKALPAFIDLLQHAEYAFPLNSLRFKNDLSINVWSKARLCSKYQTSNGEIYYAMIDLRGSKKSYLVEKCRLVPEKYFKDFNKDLNNWQRKLEKYKNNS